jgi:glycosyltransferase involved in cell wall biosynthesis
VQVKNQVLIISNYRNDKQYSMQRFGNLLLNHSNRIEGVKINEIFPRPLFGKLFSFSKLVKWAAYIDKYLVFQKRLENVLKKNEQKIGTVHIIDHSNSPYIKAIKKASSAKCLLTCHDLIAIRTAMGEFQEAPQTSYSGKRLQNWIQHSLPFADYFVCDSEHTKSDLNRIVPSSGSKSKVIHLGTNLNSVNLQKQSVIKSELLFNPVSTRFILHVGSAAWYKNRSGLFQAFRNAKQENQYNDLKLVLVGPPPQEHEINPSLKKWIERNSGNIYSINYASDKALSQLYVNAEFLIFPSFIEGFGWPPLEAASSGCPVITTKTGAIYDLLGQNAKYVNPSDQESINHAVIKMLEHRNKINEKVSLPCDQQCQKNYHNLYRKLLKI